MRCVVCGVGRPVELGVRPLTNVEGFAVEATEVYLCPSCGDKSLGFAHLGQLLRLIDSVAHSGSLPGDFCIVHSEKGWVLG